MGSLSLSLASYRFKMRHFAPWLVMMMLPAALGRPGMLTWVCKSCANAVMVDTVDNRDRLEGLKTFSYSVQLQKGSCDNLGEVVASQYCSNCANSLGVALIKNKEGEEVVLSSLADTHSIVFFDTKIN